MEKLTPIILAIFMLLFVFLLYKLTVFISMTLARRKLINSGDYSSSTLSAILSTYFGVGNVLTSVSIPFYTTQGKRYSKATNIIITARGVFLVETRSFIGRIEGTDTNVWKASVSLKNGLVKEKEFASPFYVNEINSNSLSEIFKKENIKLNLNSYVVFGSSKVSFDSTVKKVYMLDDVVRIIKDSTEPKMPKSQRKKIKQILNNVDRQCKEEMKKIASTK